jgi:hypothetical protein
VYRDNNKEIKGKKKSPSKVKKKKSRVGRPEKHLFLKILFPFVN